MEQFLQGNKLTKYGGAFREEGVEFDDLLLMEPADLEQMAAEFGMMAHHKRRFVTAVKNLQGPGRGGEEHKMPEAPPVHRHHGPKKEVNVVFLGESGVGKSTLLKSMQDFMNGTPYEQVQATPKAVGRKEGESQTQDVTMHSMCNDEWTLNIIDTPGIGDTQGIEKDEEHVNNIVQFLGDVTFNVVCILIKRGEVRKSVRLQYVVNAIRENMPRDVEAKFMVVMTRSEVPTPDKHTLAVIKGLRLPTGNIVPINNLAYEDQLAEEDPTSMMAIAAATARRTAYYNNHQFFQLLLERAHQQQPYKGSKLLALKKKRNKLKERVGLLTLTINDTFQVERQVAEKMATLSSAKREMLNFEKFTATTTITQTRHVKLYGKITTHCNICVKACHIDCGLSFEDDLTGCCAMSGTTCGKCGCHYSHHTHLGWTTETFPETTTVVDEETRRKFQDAQGRAEMMANAKKDLEARLVALQEKRDKSLQEILPLYQELESLALVGHNESYELYVRECMKAVEKEPLPPAEKEKKLEVYRGMLQHCDALEISLQQRAKGLAKRGSAWVSGAVSTLRDKWL